VENEVWSSVGSKNAGALDLARNAAMTELLGEDKPVGFAPRVQDQSLDRRHLERHGIQYISVVTNASSPLPISFRLGVKYPDAGPDVPIKR